jgi:hypothetical protein
MKSERQRNGNISFVSVVGGKKIDFFLFEIKKNVVRYNIPSISWLSASSSVCPVFTVFF